MALNFPPLLQALLDIDWTTLGAGKNLQNTTSGGKPFSWQTPSGGGSGLYAGLITKPTLSQFTQVPGSWIGSFSDSTPGIYATSSNNISNQRIALLAQTPPSPPYTITALVADGCFLGNYSIGIGFYDGTKIEFVFINCSNSNIGRQVSVQQDTNSTTFSSNVYITYIPASIFTWLQIKNDGTNLKYLFSSDGENFNQLYTEAIGSFITPTQVAFAVNAFNVSYFNATLMSWLQT